MISADDTREMFGCDIEKAIQDASANGKSSILIQTKILDEESENVNAKALVKILEGRGFKVKSDTQILSRRPLWHFRKVEEKILSITISWDDGLEEQLDWYNK